VKSGAGRCGWVQDRKWIVSQCRKARKAEVNPKLDIYNTQMTIQREQACGATVTVIAQHLLALDVVIGLLSSANTEW
jgi:hypothetical protein